MASRDARSPLGVGWLLSWPLTLAFAALVFLCVREIKHRGWEDSPAIGGPDWEARLPARIEGVTDALRHSRLALPVPTEERKGSGSLRWVHRRYEMLLRPEERASIEATVATLEEIDPGLTVTSDPLADGFDVHIGLDGLLTHTLALRSHVSRPPPRVAMLIGALGDDLLLTRELVSVDAPLSLGVRPFRPFSREVAELAHQFHREVWLDLEGVAPPNPGEDDPFAPRPDEGTGFLDAALASVPYAVGVADDGRTVGSGAMSGAALRGEAKRRKLLYVSRVTHVGAGATQTIALSADAEDSLSAQLTRLGAKANEVGPVIGVGQSVAVTPAALRDVVPAWRAAGVDVVPVSALIERTTLSAR